MYLCHINGTKVEYRGISRWVIGNKLKDVFLRVDAYSLLFICASVEC